MGTLPVQLVSHNRRLGRACFFRRPPHRLRKATLFPAAVLILLLAWDGRALGHPISVVSEAAFVASDSITIDVEVFAEDLYFYHGLKETDAGVVSKSALDQAAAEHGSLLLERLPVFDAKGVRLTGGTVVSVEGGQFAKDLLPGELMEHSLVYRLEIPLKEPPEYLTFSQRLVDASLGFPALVDFRVKQDGLADEVAATLKPGQVRTVRFEWKNDDPTDAGSNVSRDAWMQQQRSDTLGATSLNTMRSFLYITPREVRHELLIPFPLIESFLTVDRAEPDFLTHDEQEAAKAKLGEFFAAHNPLSIDEADRQPESVRVEFFTLDDRNLAKATPRRTVSALNCRVGLIVTYPVERPPQSVKLVWDAFNREAWRVDAFCFAGDDVLRPEFSAAERLDTFVWTRPPQPPPKPVPVLRVPARPSVSIPVLSLVIGAIGVAGVWATRRRVAIASGIAVASVLMAISTRDATRLTFDRPFAATPAPDAGETDAIVRTLHSNLYRAADAATDEEVVEALTASADGDLLRTLVLQLVEYIRFGEEGGGALAIHDVDVLSGRRIADRPDTNGFDYEMTWDVTARLEHWGHIHDRRYRYDAVLAIDPRNGRWAISDIDLRDVQLLQDDSAETPTAAIPPGASPTDPRGSS